MSDFLPSSSSINTVAFEVLSDVSTCGSLIIKLKVKDSSGSTILSSMMVTLKHSDWTSARLPFDSSVKSAVIGPRNTKSLKKQLYA